MTIKATFITMVHVCRPEDGIPVALEVWRDPGNNAMVGIESSFINKPAPTIASPYDRATILSLPKSEIPEVAATAAIELWRGINANSRHITELDSGYLSENPHGAVDEYESGWWVRMPEELFSEEDRDDMLRDLRDYGFSEDFLALLRFALALGCTVINIDKGAPQIPGLNLNDW